MFEDEGVDAFGFFKLGEVAGVHERNELRVGEDLLEALCVVVGENLVFGSPNHERWDVVFSGLDELIFHVKQWHILACGVKRWQKAWIFELLVKHLVVRFERWGVGLDKVSFGADTDKLFAEELQRELSDAWYLRELCGGGGLLFDASWCEKAKPIDFFGILCGET